MLRSGPKPASRSTHRRPAADRCRRAVAANHDTLPPRGNHGAGRPLSDVVNGFLLVFAGLFPIVNPLGSAPIFLNLTRHCTEAERHLLAWRVTVNGFLLLLGSLFLGSFVLEFFGISLPVVRIAGGLVVTTMGWRLLTTDDDQQDKRAASSAQERHVLPDAFYPLTMPLTVGPGSISVAITVGSHRPAEPSSLAHL